MTRNGSTSCFSYTQEPREKEVSYATFRDLDLTNRTFRIEEKTYDGKAIRIKNRKGPYCADSASLGRCPGQVAGHVGQYLTAPAQQMATAN